MIKKNKNSFYQRYIKRTIDLILALVLLLPVLLLLAICYVAIKFETKGPAFFVQERPGLNGKIFKIYKLRTMIVETQKNGRNLSDMERLTKTGRIIRTLSLDELPQIWNIIRGEMSFIGPRPLLPQYLVLYNREQMRRHSVLPGISGWAQVNGRNCLSWDQKFEYDLWYIDHLNFLLDLKIFFMTITKVFKRKDIDVDKNNTMSEFKGNLIEEQVVNISISDKG